MIALSVPLAAHAQTRDREPSLPYTVRPNDKLIVMSQQLLTNPRDWTEVARFNRLKNANAIAPGQVINIPTRLMKSQLVEGKVISTYGDVQLSGSKAEAGNALGEGAKLQTGGNSSAVVELADGSRVTLLPNTVAEVALSRNYAARDPVASGSTNLFSGLMLLAQGALSTVASKYTRRATPLQITTPTSTMGVRGTEFRVAYDGPVTQNSRIEVLEGLVRADNNSQNTGADLPLGKGAMLNPAVKEIKVIDLLKAPDLSATPSEILKPLALWPMPALEGAESYRVQIALDDRFNKIVRDLKVSTGSANLASLDNGNWFARVRGIDGQGLEGFDSVKLIAVKDGQWRVSYSSMSLVGGKTVLSWMGQQSSGQPMVASSYSALIARDEALTQTVVKAEAASSAPRMELGDLKPGVYFIRLSSNNGLASEIYRFEIPVNWGKSVFDQTSSLQAVK